MLLRVSVSSWEFGGQAKAGKPGRGWLMKGLACQVKKSRLSTGLVHMQFLLLLLYLSLNAVSIWVSHMSSKSVFSFHLRGSLKNNLSYRN